MSPTASSSTRANTARTTPDIEIMAQSQLWSAVPDADAIVRRAIAVAADADDVELPSGAEVSIVLSDDDTIRVLNNQWRGQDKPTNVLSFPTSAAAAEGLLGDIVIAFETVKREADDEGKPFAHHLAHLTVHGFLHLLGYDHDTDDSAGEMERIERTILARLAIPDPYGTLEVES